MSSGYGASVTVNDFATQAKTIADIIVYVWLFSLAIALALGKNLNEIGFTFRTLPGFWSPPVSASINRTERVFANAEMFLLLGTLLLLRGTRDLVIVTLIALLVDCLNGLLFPKSARFFSSSNILFSYLGFLLLRGYFEPAIVAILVTILVGCVCSWMLWGMVPISGDSVWKARLISFLGGVLAARFLDGIAALFPVSQLW
ncbi:hypothetical protein OsccyDRAFT_2061 [Leptolyngbyaceae cyanobacterium JSC-12]|nr:hypothetical protein OsccyDRAFT_2061 [Leptolyngbyaceae cyanobacterium JSC-12]